MNMLGYVSMPVAAPQGFSSELLDNRPCTNTEVSQVEKTLGASSRRINLGTVAMKVVFFLATVASGQSLGLGIGSPQRIPWHDRRFTGTGWGGTWGLFLEGLLWTGLVGWLCKRSLETISGKVGMRCYSNIMSNILLERRYLYLR